MIFSFLRRIQFHLKKWIFQIEYGKAFKSYCYSSTILDPLKIKGHRNIFIGKNVFIHSKVWLETYKIDNDDPILEIGDATCIGKL